MKVLVTGASGFLGTHLVPALRASGHDVVTERADVGDAAAIERVARGCEALVHAAGMVSRRREDAERLHRVHVTGTRTAIEAAHRAGVRRVVHVSTSGVVAVSEDEDFVATEDDETPWALIQRWPYYRSKLFAEKTALELGEELPGLEVVCVNPTLLLGPGDVRGSSTDDVRNLIEGRVPMCPPGGLSFVDVRDAAAATVRALERGEPGRRYLLGSANLTLRAFFDKVARVSGVSAPRIDLPSVRGLDAMLSSLADRAARLLGTDALDPVSLEMACVYWYLDATRAEKELGFAPRDPMDTLVDTVDDLRARQERKKGARAWSDEVAGS